MKIALGADSAGKPLIDVIEAHLKTKSGLEVTNMSKPGFYADISADVAHAPAKKKSPARQPETAGEGGELALIRTLAGIFAATANAKRATFGAL